MIIYTIGHSTHSWQEFIEILQSFDIATLVDIRSYPGSKYVPHFNKEIMKDALLAVGVTYVHIPELGGRRRKLDDIDDSLIAGWRHIAFKNYSAYTLTDKFDAGLDELIKIAKDTRVCIMCAESVPWKCHRLLVSNSLTARKVNVEHIISADKSIVHEINKYGATATIIGTKVIYPRP